MIFAEDFLKVLSFDAAFSGGSGYVSFMFSQGSGNIVNGKVSQHFFASRFVRHG